MRKTVGRLMRAITTSRVNYILSYWVDLACALAMAIFGSLRTTGWQSPLLSLAAGALLFTLIEYFTHRWFFHERGKFASTIHRRHHERPADPTALPFFSSPLAAATGFCVFAPLIGTETFCFLMSGVLTGYLYYSVIHHLQHSVRASSVGARWLAKRWALHASHHARPNINYGVTTSLWDHAFGTYYLPRKRATFSRAAAASRVSGASAP